MNDINSIGSSELGTKDTGGEVFLSQFPVSVDGPECNGMESVTKEDGMGLDGSTDMVEKIATKDGENPMDDSQDRAEGDHWLSRPGSVDGIQINQDTEDSIPSLPIAKSTGDGIQDDSDGEETLAKFKRPSRSKKPVVKNALEDDIGNEALIPREKDTSLSKYKAVQESDGENLMDETEADPDGEEGDRSSPQFRSIVDDIQVIQDDEESIPSPCKPKSIGDSMADPDEQETLAKFKRGRRSKKTRVKVSSEDDVGNEMEVPIDKDKGLSEDKTVQESDGENIMDDIEADSDAEEGDHSSPMFRNTVDSMQAIQDAEESIPSPPKAKSIGDGMADPDGEETLAKFKRPRRSKKSVAKVALQGDVGNEMEVLIDKGKRLSKYRAVQESDGQTLMDETEGDPDGEEGNRSSPQSTSIVDDIQDAEENIPSLPKPESIGDGMADPDGQETLAKFKRLRQSKKSKVKVALEDDLGNDMEVPIDKDKGLSKDKTVRESDGENLMNDIEADSDGDERDCSSPKFRNTVDSMQAIQDAEESIPSPHKAKSIGDGMADHDGEETLAKFKRPRRSKKPVAKVALQDDVGNEMEVLIDKDKILLKNKAVRESDGENLMDNIQFDPDGKQGDYSSPKSRIVVGGMQVIQDAEESIWSLPKAKSIGDGMQADPDGQETPGKFKRLRRKKKAAVKVALQDDVGNDTKVPIDKDKSLLKDKAVQESDGENLLDDIQPNPEGEEGDQSSSKSRHFVYGVQVLQDAEKNIPSLPKDKNIGDGMQDDPDGEETLAKFKRPRRSKKAVVKVGLQDVGNEMEVSIDKDKSLSKDKAVRESDGENLMDNTQVEPDGEEGDQSLPKSRTVVDGIQDTEDVEESIQSLPKAKSIGDGMQDDTDGEETLAKFRRPRRSKKEVVKDALEDVGNEAVPIDTDKISLKDKAIRETDDIPAKIKKPRRLKKREVMDALEVDLTKATETSGDNNQNLKGNIAEDTEDTLTHFKKKKKTPKSAKDLPKVASASRQASVSENDMKETANTDQISKWQKTDGSSQGSPSAPAEKTRASKGVKSSKGSLESNPDGTEKVSAVKASDIKKGKRQSDSQRAVRHVKKRRHGDMAYEGDSDWDVLLNGEEALENKSIADKERLGRSRNRAGLLSGMLAQIVPGEEAAVAAGLKVRLPGPAEKIKFREVLKRRGGLQEYLECRNSILWLWDKDVRRILPLSDCGVSSIPLPDESPRDALIRDVYNFLDYHGYINVGIAVKKPKTKDDFEPKLKLSKESMQTENCGDKVADAEEEVAFILGQIKVSEENLSPAQNQIQVEGENQILLLDVEDAKRNKLAENCSGLTESDKKDSEECGIAFMEIDVTPVVAPHKAENSTVEAARSSVVKSEGDIESAVAHKDNEELGTRGTSGSGGTEDVFLGNDHVVKMEVDPLVKVNSALDQIKNSYGEDEFSDIDSAKVLHNLHKHDLQVDLQTDNQESKLNAVSEANDANSVLEGRKRIIVIGGGPAGLAAARHLQRLNCNVTVLEARDRVGGRVYTDRSALSVPVDLGASIITGVEADVATERRPDPSALLCTQLGLELTVLNSDCPLYDSVTGQKVPSTLDEALEAEYNSLLDDMLMLVAQNGDVAMRMSLEEGLEYALKKRRVARSSSTFLELASSKALLNDPDSGSIIEDSSVGTFEALSATVDSSLKAVSENNVSVAAGMENEINMESQPDKLNLLDNSSMEQHSLSPLERRVMDWHFANLEYGCAAELSRVSLPYWNQDDAYGGFGGAHCMIKGGYSTVMEALAEGLNIQLGHIVTEISYSMKDPKSKGGIKGEVKVWTENSQEFVGDAVLITVPLGCLKANTIKFSPELPDWKLSSIQQLGFGVLNKVIMEFPNAFWDESVDYFGATAEITELRGRCFMFWNLKKTVGAPVLIALVVGKAAIDGQNLETSDHVKHAVMILRKLFGETTVPDPIASVATNWGGDPFSRGAYSYVAVGASGEDYDILGRPVENCLFFAGEATCKEHPDTVGGAMMSGLREAVRIVDILENREDSMAEAEAMAAAQRHSDSERNEVRDMVKRLDAGELSSVLCKGSLDGEQKPLSKDALLQDMLGNAKTTAGRLFLAKKMLQLPAAAVKAFAGTKEGLSILNNWILDSMGKDGTQLLRHCVRLLLIVSTDMIAVRQSGIGRTVKEKVCVHTSRDIRAVASQLVKMWIEVFRKEKANGGSKLLKQLHGSASNPSSSDAVKAKSKEQSSGKPSAIAANDVKGNTDQSPSTPINKNPALHSVHMEDGSELKKEANSVGAQTSDQGQPKKSEDCALSELEAAAIAAEEAARAAAAAAAEAYATSEAECSTFRELPKIPSFHKFARREQYVQKEDSDVRKRKWSGAVLGKQDCSSEIDSRSCRVRNWSVDFAATCGNIDSSRLAGPDFGSGNILPTTDSNKKQRSHSNDVDSHSDLKERSAETGAVDSKSTKIRVQNSGSITGIKIPDSRAKQPYSLGSHLEIFDQSIQKLNCSSKTEQICIGKARHSNDDKGVAEAGANRGSPGARNGHKDEARGADHIKKGLSDYVASLLMPLYKTKKIDKDGYKSIMKKSTIKVMEHNTPAENAMTVSEFLDCKRRNKIRSLVDKFIEKHMASTQL